MAYSEETERTLRYLVLHMSSLVTEEFIYFTVILCGKHVQYMNV